MPRDAEIFKNVPPMISDFAVQRADVADLAVPIYQMVAIAGQMPAGGTNRVKVAVCSIPALLTMKGHAIEGATSRRMPTTFTTASATSRVVQRRSRRHVALCSVTSAV